MQQSSVGAQSGAATLIYPQGLDNRIMISMSSSGPGPEPSLFSRQADFRDPLQPDSVCRFGRNFLQSGNLHRKSHRLWAFLGLSLRLCLESDSEPSLRLHCVLVFKGGLVIIEVLTKRLEFVY